MSNITVTIVEGTKTANFAQALNDGKVRFYRVRGDGSTRHVPFLAPGTEAREAAEKVLEQREQGVTMKVIAADLHASVPTVRRLLNSLLLTQEVEGYSKRKIATVLKEAAVEPQVTTEATNDKPKAVKATDPSVMAFLEAAAKKG